MMRAWLWAGFLALLLCLRPAEAAAETALVLEAENLELSDGGDHIRAEGNVVLTYGDLILRADEAICRGKQVEASGSVSLASPTAELRASRLSVDLASGAVAAEKLEGRIDGYFVEAAALRPTQSGGRVLEEAGFTRCDLDVPCYQFRAAKIAIEGRRVTILRAWLALGGRRLIPLPRITLDLDRLEEWPLLNAGYDERGFYLETSFAVPLRPRLDLVLDGEFGTISGAYLKLAAPWYPNGKVRIEPWFAWASSADAPWFGLAITGPSHTLMGGAVTLGGQYTWKTGSPAAEGTLRWSHPLSAGGVGEIGLVMGWRSTPVENRPLLELQIASSRRATANWDLSLSCAYDLIAGAWEETELAATRYFHCFFARFGLDLLQGGLLFSGGIRF